jgi:hypothetical protein
MGRPAMFDVALTPYERLKRYRAKRRAAAAQIYAEDVLASLRAGYRALSASDKVTLLRALHRLVRRWDGEQVRAGWKRKRG